MGLQHPEVDTAVALAAAESMGVLTRHELRACGLSDEAIKVRVRAGRLHRLYRGVYAVGHLALTHEARWLAAAKAAGPDAVLAGISSLMLFGLLPVEDRRPEVLIPAGAKVTVGGIRVRRTRNLHPEDAQRHKGIPTCSAARAIFDVAPRTTDKGVRRLMSRAQSAHHTNLRLLARQLDRANGRRSARYARVLATGPAPTRSELEDRVLDLLGHAGFPRPDVNVPLRIGARTVIPDFRWPEHRLVLEADGAQWHDNPQQRLDDAERQALLEQHGETVLRVDWSGATAGARRTVARLEGCGLPHTMGPWEAS